jgi:hypothetical protein
VLEGCIILKHKPDLLNETTQTAKKRNAAGRLTYGKAGNGLDSPSKARGATQVRTVSKYGDETDLKPNTFKSDSD